MRVSLLRFFFFYTATIPRSAMLGGKNKAYSKYILYRFSYFPVPYTWGKERRRSVPVRQYGGGNRTMQSFYQTKYRSTYHLTRGCGDLISCATGDDATTPLVNCPGCCKGLCVVPSRRPCRS